MATETMYAAVLRGENDLRYEQIDRPIPGDGQVVVDVKATGVCGSDIPRVFSTAAHFYPLVLGHEVAGVIADVGPGVAESWLGTRVAVVPLVPCHACEACSLGRFSQCPHYSFIGSSLNGGLAEYLVAPTKNLVRIGERLSFVQGALVEPSSVALHGILVGNYLPGQDVAVLGAGMIGNFTAQWAKLLGAQSVTVFDINDHRLAVAQEVGVDNTINSAADDVAGQVQAITGGKGFGHVFETAGQNATQCQALEVAGSHGSVTLIGTSHGELSFPAATFELLNRKELTLSASWMSYSAPFPGREWTQTIRYLEEGRLLTPPSLLHAEFPLSSAWEGMTVLSKGTEVRGKVMFVQD